MAAPYILARTLKEAHEFARDELGLERGHYRVVNSPSTIKAVFTAEVYLVPGWERRYDRFAMKSALRYTRMTVVEVGQDFLNTEQADPRGELTDEILALAYAEHDVREGRGAPGMTSTGVDEVSSFFDEVTNGDQMVSEGSPAEPEVKDPEPAEKVKPKRRRSRCRQCGTLHLKEDPCPDGDES